MRLNIFSKRMSYSLQALSCLVLGLFLNINVAFASSETLAPSVKTNKNVVSTEFNDHIVDKAALDAEVENLRSMATEKAKTPDQAEFLSEEERGKLGSEQARLSSVRDTDLESEGRKVRYSEENVHFNDFETEYTKAGAMAHKKDADEIVDSTETAIGKLTEYLREKGLDCTEAAKSPEIKDPYYIEIEKEEIKEVDYDQKFCEFPRANYSCSDSLSVICNRRGWAYGSWQPRDILINGRFANNQGWLHGIHWTKSRTGLHMRHDGWVRAAIRGHIASVLNVRLDQISEGLDYSARGEGGLPEFYKKHFGWDNYRVRYSYRDANEICEQWSPERWDETCGLSSR